MDLKTGRNQPCPCGSGKKYKNCCRAADEEARRAERGAQRRSQVQAVGAVDLPPDGPERLDELSNGVLDLIRDGRLDEAEQMCNQLLTEFPEVIDGHMRLGHLYRVRGDAKRAAEHIRLAAAMARTPDYDDDVATGLEAEADKLDPPTP